MKGVFFASVTALAISASYGSSSHPRRTLRLFSINGKFDKSFNEGVYNGVKKIHDDSGIQVREFEPKNEAQVEQVYAVLPKRGTRNRYVVSI